MKKFFTLIAAALLSVGSINAQTDGVVELTYQNVDQDKSNATSLQTYYFTNTDITMKMSGRALRERSRTKDDVTWNEGLNFKNNTTYSVVLPEGTQMYGIAFAGYSEGSNWNYLYAYGVGEQAGVDGTMFEWVDPIGSGVGKDDYMRVINEAKYPMDPCVAGLVAGEYEDLKEVYNTPGYTFAFINFGDEPYEGEFPFRFSGSNQTTCKLIVFTTKEAAASYVWEKPYGPNNLPAEGGAGDPANTIELSWATMDKDEAGTNAADQNNITFNGNDGFILKPTGGRTQAGPYERESCSGKALNFKNNTNQTLVIPEGKKVYKINFYGWSQGDNWTYLYAYGPVAGEWEWTDPIGEKNQDNKVIIEQAKYPLDPCVVDEANAKNGYSPVFHNAGYCFASIDFSAEPYEGEFSFVFNGNNQERVWMVVYTSKAAAKAAEAAEAVTIGKENSQKNFLNSGETDGIEGVAAKPSLENGIIYNMAGQKVSNSYKGLVIMNGKKYILK